MFVSLQHQEHNLRNMNTAALNNLWSYLQGLSLTATNQRWLASHLMEAAENIEKGDQKKELVFPKIPKDYVPSEKVMAMALGTLTDDADLEKEIEERWARWNK